MTALSIDSNVAAPVLFLVLLAIFFFFGSLFFLFAWNFRPSPPLEPNPNPGRVVIVVPVRDDPSIFNSLPLLKRLEYPYYEILIVDDSTDPQFLADLERHRDDRVHIIHRPHAKGRKAGAINFGLEFLASSPPEYIVILDADHRPPTDFLARAVTLIEQSGAHCVEGYQRHDIGADGFFGSFYRAGAATSFRNLKGQSNLGFGVYFAGAPAIFRYEWIREKGFDETSITEDWELTLRAYGDGDFEVVVREDLWVSAAVPKNLAWFVRQQIRWSEGITRDFRKHVKRLVRSNLPLRAKVGLFYQGLMGLQGPSFLVFWFVLPILFPARLSIFTMLGLFALLAVTWGWPVYKGARFEGYRLKQIAGVLTYGLLISYVLIPFGTYAFISGLFRNPSSWTVTKRRG
jgi:cellulose synthase/poly-beta-1,6-N-acetylglucosamine synthase-like glycosyltransferase